MEGMGEKRVGGWKKMEGMGERGVVVGKENGGYG